MKDYRVPEALKLKVSPQVAEMLEAEGTLPPDVEVSEPFEVVDKTVQPRVWGDYDALAVDLLNGRSCTEEQSHFLTQISDDLRMLKRAGVPMFALRMVKVISLVGDVEYHLRLSGQRLRIFKIG